MAAVYPPAEFFDSDEWADLSPRASRLLLDMASGLNGRNNGAIRHGVADAAALLHCDRAEAGGGQDLGDFPMAGLSPPIPAARWRQQQGA